MNLLSKNIRIPELIHAFWKRKHKIAFAVASMVLGPMAFAQSAEPARLRLDWTTLGYHAPFFYGMEQGIYEKAGIKLSIEEGKGSASVAQLAANGSDDFGFADATTVAQLVDKGLPAKVVMGILRGTTLSLFYAPGRGISKPADLKGRKIAVCPGDAISVYIPPYLKSLGLTGSEVELLPVDCNLKYTVVAQGRADAVMSYGTAGGPLLQKVGIANAPSFSAGPGFYLPAHGIVVSDKVTRDRPDFVRRFVSATAEAWAAAAKDPDAAIQAVIKARPLIKNEGETLKQTFQVSLNYLNAPSSSGQPFGWQATQDWNVALEILRQYANVGVSLTPARVMTNQFVEGR